MSIIVASQDSIWCCSRCHAVYRKELGFCPADGGEVVVAQSDPLVGTDVGQYSIEALIGEGAMGRVYRAHHKHLADRVYALKVLLGDLASTQEMRMRFLNEAKSASKLSHPNVVTVYDVGRTDKGLLYLVMELVEGETLTDIIARGPMDPQLVGTLARGICDGLAHAHANGIVHRDLKPDNVIVVRSSEGELVPRIVDFGIAVSIEGEDSRLTATGMSMGTPGYVAPEQVSGERVGASADQYALGVTMFEMLTGGELPFSGMPMEVAAAKTTRDAPVVSACMPNGGTVPPQLEKIVARMLCRKPAQRYESVAGVSRMLARWTNAPETEIIPTTSRLPRYAWAAGLAVLLGAGGVIAWRKLSSSEPAHASVAAAPTAVAAAPAPAPATPPAPPPVDDAIELAQNDTTDDTTDTTADTTDDTTDPNDTAGTNTDRSSSKRRRTAGRTKKTAPRVAAATRPDPTPTPTPEPPTPTPAPVPTSPLIGRMQQLSVTGAMSQTDVRRALQRIEPSLQRCTTTAQGTAVVRFSIDDTRRPQNVRGSGVPGPTLSCLVSAIGKVRTEVAPDVGDAEVTVSIVFTSST